ncbi:peptidoglycan-binding protein [Dendrosporobacter sp. 1207_IL3150]|uniref:peptidoglycan-binding protein n=1 Tax=Dendrosporobacter sp. 1207_IL3150 TaxID=3084054 RepID=UPI002FD99A04
MNLKMIILVSMLIISVSSTVLASDIKVVARYGMKGENVILVQKYLAKAGYYKGKNDGVFSNSTLAAVKDFQRKNNLYADGIVGQQTFSYLRQYSSAISKKPAIKRPGIAHTPQYPAGKVIPMIATAYTRYDEGCTDYTYRGNYLRRGLVAVDPTFIPLGTKLFIPGYGYAVADDIGGAIKGNKIDLAVDTVDEAFAYGVRHVDVVVVE